VSIAFSEFAFTVSSSLEVPGSYTSQTGKFHESEGCTSAVHAVSSESGARYKSVSE